MENVLLVIHLIVSVALVGLILLQRSEGGGLVGGGGNMGAVAPRSQVDGITKLTYWIAAAFMCTSLLLVISANNKEGSSLVDKLAEEPATSTDTTPVEGTPPVTGTAPAETTAPTPPEAPAVPVAQ